MAADSAEFSAKMRDFGRKSGAGGKNTEKNADIRHFSGLIRIMGKSATNSKKPRLVFPPGERCGWTPVAMSISSDKEAPAVVREILQNSLDAAKGKAEVKFFVENIPIKDIPGIEEYRQAIESGYEYWKKVGWAGQSKDIVESIKKRLNQSKLPVLFVADNGRGFNKGSMEAILSDGITNKSGEKSLGSHGNGHFTVFNLSGLRYLLYGGVSEQDGSLVSGHAILASHPVEGRVMSGKNGFYCMEYCNTADNLCVFPADEREIPSVMGDKLSQIKSKSATGSLLAVVDFNYFGEKYDASADQKAVDFILAAAARNFFVAIQQGRLSLSVKIGETKSVLNASNLELVMNELSPDIARVRNFPHHKIAQSFHKLYKNPEKTKTIETDSGQIEVRYRETEVNSTKIIFCRDGMWITESVPYVKPVLFDDNVPFEALLLCNKDSGDLYDLFVKAEGNLHNSLALKLIEDDSKRKLLRDALNKTKQILRDSVEKQDTDTLEFEEVDYIGPMLAAPKPLISAGGSGGGGGGGNGGGGGGGGRQTVKSGKDLLVNAVSVREGKNKMKIRMHSTLEAQDVEFRLALHGGGDVSCDSEQAENEDIKITKAVCDGEQCDVQDGFARIGKIDAGGIKNIEVEFNEEEIKIQGDYRIECKFIRRARAS